MVTIRASVRRLVVGLGRWGIALVDRLTAGPHEKRLVAWRAADGDAGLRFDYPLESTSVVLDVGGFDGQWASDLFGRTLATVHICEPVPALAEELERRFAANPRIVVHPVGLAGSTKTTSIVVDGPRSSVHVGGGERQAVRLVRAGDFLDEVGLTGIDLLKINIEGGEYELLEHLLDQGVMDRITDVQVQFHDFVRNAERRMRAIQQRLAVTHELVWQFEFVWESWHRRD